MVKKVIPEDLRVGDCFREANGDFTENQVTAIDAENMTVTFETVIDWNEDGSGAILDGAPETLGFSEFRTSVYYLT